MPNVTETIDACLNCTLDDLLNYNNPNVIEGFMKSLDVTIDEAKDVFQETLKWFWYCNHPSTDGFRSIDQSLVIIDEMWHTFILYTKDYAVFCNKYFGHYIHHAPTLNAELEVYKNTSKEEKYNRKRKQLELVYDTLGRDTFIKWYVTYPENYSRGRIKEIRKK